MNGASAGFSIVIVDDQLDLAILMADELRDLGYDCTTAVSLAESLALIEKRRFNAIISDIQLGDGSGKSLIPKLKSLGLEATPLIFITGYISGTEYKDLASHEMVLSKPINIKVLDHLLDKLRSDFFKTYNPYAEAPKDPTQPKLSLEFTVVSADQKSHPAALIGIDPDGVSVELGTDLLKVGEQVTMKVVARSDFENADLNLVGVVKSHDALSSSSELFKIQLSESSAHACEQVESIIARQQEYISQFLNAARGV